MNWLKPAYKQVKMIGGPYSDEIYKVHENYGHIEFSIHIEKYSLIEELAYNPAEKIIFAKIALPIKKDPVSIAWYCEWDYEQEALLRGCTVEELWIRDGKQFGLAELAKKYPPNPKKISDHSEMKTISNFLVQLQQAQAISTKQFYEKMLYDWNKSYDWTGAITKTQDEINSKVPLEGETMGNIQEVTILDILSSVLDIEPLPNEEGYRLKPKDMKPIPCRVCDEQGVFQVEEEVDGVVTNSETIICPVCDGEAKFDIKFHWSVSHAQLAATVKEFNNRRRATNIRRI